MFERWDEVLTRRGESSLDDAFRRVLGDLVFELDAPVHGRTPADQAADGPDPVDVPASSEAAFAARADHIEHLATVGAEHLAVAQEEWRRQARAAARQARALAAFARHRPSSLDRPDGEIGAAAAASRAARPAVLTRVSEWAVDEVMVALSLNSSAATVALVDSLKLVDRLPLTLAALDEGRISCAHAKVMTDVVAPLDDDVRAVAEARLMARVEGKTHNQLRVAARRVVQRLDAGAVARRVTEAIRDRRVVVYPGDDGMATVSVVLPLPVARAVADALRQYADAAATECDERTRAQRMVDCLVDLVLRPGEHGLSPVQARLTIVAAVETLLGSDEPGEVDGELVPAHLVRELAVALGLLPPLDPTPRADDAASATDPDPVEPEGGRDAGPDGGTVDRDAGTPTRPASSSPGRQGTGSPQRIRELAGLLALRQVRGSALEHRPEVALVDELSGQLVALTNAFGLRRGNGLGPPPESPGYRPEAELDRFVRLRDRRCRFPGCRARPVRCDLDHEIPWPWGPTSHDNLCCLCRHHHRLGHQAPGWRLRGLADGGLEWTTPGGVVATTHPPRFGADDDLPRDGGGRPPSAPDAEGDPPSARAPATAGAAPPPDVRDDPPPF